VVEFADVNLWVCVSHFGTRPRPPSTAWIQVELGGEPPFPAVAVIGSGPSAVPRSCFWPAWQSSGKMST